MKTLLVILLVIVGLIDISLAFLSKPLVFHQQSLHKPWGATRPQHRELLRRTILRALTTEAQTMQEQAQKRYEELLVLKEQNPELVDKEEFEKHDLLFKTFDTLKKIEADIVVISSELKSANSKRREKAKKLHKELTDLRDSIEEGLNDIASENATEQPES